MIKLYYTWPLRHTSTVVGKVWLRSRMRLFGPLSAALVQISMDSRIAPMVSVALEKNIIWNIFIDAPIDMATKKKQRKTEDENREFRVEWTENFAFIRNLNGHPTCLICKEKFAHNKKSNLDILQHASFSTKYPAGDARKKAVEELQKSQESSTSVFNNWMQSSSNINMASFVVSQEIAKRGKPYTDCDT